MRREIVEEIRSLVSELIGKTVAVAEPDWSGFVDYPAVYMEVGEERTVKAVSGHDARELFVDVYVVDRCLPNNADERYLELLELIEKIDDHFRKQRHYTNLHVYIERCRVQALKQANDNYVLVGAGIRLKVYYMM